MYPYIDLGFYRLPTFWLINIIGVLVCALMLFIRNKDFSFLNVDITNAGAIGICGAVVGAKVLFALTIIPVLIKYREYYFSSFEIFFTAVSSGAVFYGGLILFIIVINWYLNRYSINKKTYWDFMAPCIPLFHVFGRIGCFLNGCCHGVVSERFGIAFSNSPSSINGIPYLPVQLIEAFLNLCLFFALIIFEKKYHNQGKILYVYIISYGVIRFITEFFRGDAIRGIWFFLSTSQWISLILICYGIYKLVTEIKKIDNKAVS